MDGTSMYNYCPTFFLFWKCLDDMSYWTNLYRTVADNQLHFFTISNLNYTVFVSLAHMISKGYRPLITKPTRVTTYSATLIDHIYSNATSQNYDSGIIISDVAEHFGAFYASRKYSSKNLPTYTRTRQMKQVNISNFKELLSSTEFNTVLSDECPNSAYNTFLHIYKHAYDKAFPLNKCQNITQIYLQ